MASASRVCCNYCKTEKTDASAMKKCAGCREDRAVNYCSKDCQRKDWPHHKTICNFKKKICSDFKSARADAKKLLPPRSRIVTSYNDIPHEYEADITRNRFLIVRAVKVPMKALIFLRPSYIVKDEHGNKALLAFYLDDNDPSPHFEFTDILPGTFLCILDARLHDFMDGQTGFRIEDAQEIMILAKH